MRPALIAVGLAGALVIPTTADAKTYIGSRRLGEYETRRVVKPSQLPLVGPHELIADSIYLRRVHWDSWGGDVARAKAVYKQRDDEPWHHVKVRAYGVRRCSAVPSFRLYTRVRVRGTDYRGEPWAHTWKTPSCSIVMGWMD